VNSLIVRSTILIAGKGDILSELFLDMLVQGKWIPQSEHTKVNSITTLQLVASNSILPTQELQLWAFPMRLSLGGIMVICRRAKIAIVVLDLEDQDNKLNQCRDNSLGEAQSWVHQLRQRIKKVNNDFPIILIGLGHSDKVFSSKWVTKIEIEEYCQKNQVTYFEITEKSFPQQITIILRCVLDQMHAYMTIKSVVPVEERKSKCKMLYSLVIQQIC
jgi:hypothetical protein